MKSRMIVSFMVIALAAALIGGATMAWFTDSDTVDEPITFTAGTLLIDLTDPVQTTNINIGNLNPGDEFEYEFEVVNDGSKNLIFTGILCYDERTGKENEAIPFDDRYEGYGTGYLSEVLEMEIWVKGQDKPFYSGTLADYKNEEDPIGGYPKGLPEFENPPIVFGEASLTPGEDSKQNSLTYIVKFKLPEETDNKYQGSSIELALSVLAKQIHPDAEYPEFACPFHEHNAE